LLIASALARDGLDALVKVRGWLGLAEHGGGAQDESDGKKRPDGDERFHAWSVGAPGPIFKSFQLDEGGRRR
jgi:hypothetical protein